MTPHRDDLAPLEPPPAPSSWLRGQVTLGNLVMAGSVLVGAGGYLKGYAALEAKVAAQDEQLMALQTQFDKRLHDEQERNAETFSRRDVLEALLISINSRLTNIEGDVREMKRRGQ